MKSVGLCERSRTVDLRDRRSAVTYETLDVHRDGPVGWLIFDRPDAANAMDATMLAELERAWRELELRCRKTRAPDVDLSEGARASV